MNAGRSLTGIVAEGNETKFIVKTLSGGRHCGEYEQNKNVEENV